MGQPIVVFIYYSLYMSKEAEKMAGTVLV